MRKNLGKAILAVLAWSVICQPVLADNTTVDGMVKTYIDQGKSAMHDKHYRDAAEWYRRAIKQAELDKKGDRLLAGLYEMLGYAYLNDKNYTDSMVALQNGYQKYETSMGAFNSDTARIFDQIGEIDIETKDYGAAEIALVGAYNRSMGNDPKVVADPKVIGYRANRLALICSLSGGLSDAARFSTSIARGRSSDDMYADAVKELRRKEKAGGDSRVIDPAIKDVFSYWKTVVDRGGSPVNKAHYETCWNETYGTAPSTVIVSTPDTGHLMPNPFSGGSTHFRNPFTSSDLLKAPPAGGAKGTKAPSPSPWGSDHAFAYGEQIGLESLEETMKKLGL